MSNKQKKRNRKNITWIIVIILLLAAGAAGFTSYNKSKKETRWKLQEYQAVESVYIGDLDISILATATLNPFDTVAVRPEASGRVEKLYADTGDWVEKGDPLVELDQEDLITQLESARVSLKLAQARLDEIMRGYSPRERQNYEAAVESAKISLVDAQREYDRILSLHQAGFASDRELDSATTILEQAKQNLENAEKALRVLLDGPTDDQIKQAKASVESAQIQVKQAENALGDATIYSPMTGIVLDRFVTEGSIVVSTLASFSQGDAIFTIGDLSKMKGVALVNESDIGDVKIGQTVKITVESYEDETFQGTVLKIHPKANQQGGVTNFTVEIEVPNPDSRLMAGMTADIEIVTDSFSNLLLVPDVAIAEHNEKTYVFVVDENDVISIREVEIGETNFEATEILSGLKEGEKVITKGVPRDLLDTLDKKKSDSGIKVQFN